MTTPVLKVALRRTAGHVRHVTAVRRGAATGLVDRVYQQVEADFGMLAPPVVLHSPAPDVLAAVWAVLRETLVADGAASRATRELVAAAVSAANACPYCVQVHDATRQGLRAAAHPADAPLAAWVSGTGPAPGLDPVPLAELAGVAVLFHYLNRLVTVFLRDSPLPDALPRAARTGALAALGRYLGATARARHPAGESAVLLPAAPLPPDLAWAQPSAPVADAFARACAVFDAVPVPAAVRSVVQAELSTWDGQLRGLGRAWVTDAVAGLEPADRPAGCFALLVALAAFQVTAEDVAAVRATGADDAALVRLAGWAAWSAARRRGVLLAG